MNNELLFICGTNAYDLFGIENDYKYINLFENISYIKNVISLSCGEGYALILTKEGLYSSGYNNKGQLGLGHNFDIRLFEKINIENVISFSCGYNHTVVITENGLYSCGSNNHGQLGLGDTDTRNLFNLINIQEFF
jgi:alpha-tubulin suppressor-like RCC1 family protein